MGGSDSPPWREVLGPVLFVISVGWFFSLGVRLIYPIVLPQLAGEFRIDYGTAGVVLSVLWISYATMSVPGGIIADRFGERIVLVGAIGVATVGTLLVVSAPTFLVFVAATMVLGAGCGMFGTPGTTVLSDVYANREATAIGLSQVAGNVGTIILPVCAGLLASWVGWRVGLGYVLPGLVFLMLGLWLVIPERTSQHVRETGGSLGETINRIGSIFAQRSLLLIVLTMSCLAFVYQGLTGFLPAYLIDIKGFEPWLASVVFGVMFTGMIIGMLGSGPVASKYGHRAALVGFIVISAPAVVALPFVDNLLVLVPLVWISGLMSGFFPVGTAYVLRFIPDDVQGSVFGLVRTSFIGVGVLAPPIVGVLADRGQFDLGILLLGVVGMLAILSSVRLPRLHD